MVKRLYVSFVLLLIIAANACAQKITGVVVDAHTGDSIPMAGIVYRTHNVMVAADHRGCFSIDRHNGWKLFFTAVGYKTHSINVSEKTRNHLVIKLKPDTKTLNEVVVRSKRSRYSRKNNPAVELMRRVIAAKKKTDLDNNDFYEYYKSEMQLNQTIYISGVSMQTLIREAKIVGFYNQPDENSAMYSIVYADPSLARAFADLTYGANFVQELPDEIDFSISDASEDDLFGDDDDLFADSTFDDSFIASSDVDFDDILGDTTLRDELNKTDDGAWHYILLRV